MQERFAQTAKTQDSMKKLQKRSTFKQRQNALTTKVLPDFDFKSVERIPEGSVKELRVHVQDESGENP